MVLEMADVKSILDSTELGAMTPNIVRPGFEGTSTWEEILGILEDDSASAFGCSASNRKLTQGNK